MKLRNSNQFSLFPTVMFYRHKMLLCSPRSAANIVWVKILGLQGTSWIVSVLLFHLFLLYSQKKKRILHPRPSHNIQSQMSSEMICLSEHPNTLIKVTVDWTLGIDGCKETILCQIWLLWFWLGSRFLSFLLSVWPLAKLPNSFF